QEFGRASLPLDFVRYEVAAHIAHIALAGRIDVQQQCVVATKKDRSKLPVKPLRPRKQLGLKGDNEAPLFADNRSCGLNDRRELGRVVRIVVDDVDTVDDTVI